MRVCDFRTIISALESWGFRAGARVYPGPTGQTEEQNKLVSHGSLAVHKDIHSIREASEELSTEGQCCGLCPCCAQRDTSVVRSHQLRCF